MWASTKQVGVYVGEASMADGEVHVCWLEARERVMISLIGIDVLK